MLQPFYHTGMENFYHDQKCRFGFVDLNDCVDFKYMRWLNKEDEDYKINLCDLSIILTRLGVSHNFLFDNCCDEFVLLCDIEL
jgi:hypothetical protein